MRMQDGEKRSLEQLREQYEVEKELGTRLRLAKKEERRRLYTSVYDELFTRIPHHPQLAKRDRESEAHEAVQVQMALLRQFLKSTTTFLEIGAGSCHLSREVAKHVKKVYAIDVSEELTNKLLPIDNFEFIISDGCSIPVPANSVDVAYSYQLIEHLHPDDTYEQLVNICRAIMPQGMYICATTNKLSGPHDISKYFDKIATGFHLNEYTASELRDLFLQCGFSKVKFCMGIKGKYFIIPFGPIKWIEKVLNKLPVALCRRISRTQPIRKLIEEITILGIKEA